MFDLTQSSNCATQINHTGVPPVANLAKRQAYGAYYTPLRVASLLADWAIRDRNDVVLEPCFGGCDFLDAMRNRFEACGQQSLDHHIFGCDIDPDAFIHLSSRMQSSTRPSNFIQADFLTLTPANFGQKKFDAVIGNPPYIKNDRISSVQKESIKCLAPDAIEIVKGRANLWAYFIAHALSFLRAGGRIALVLPDNFLSADYSERLRDALLSKFSRVMAISVSERLFLSQGTEERTVVLLCDGYQQGSASAIKVMYCSNVNELGNLFVTNAFDDSNCASGDADDYSRLTREQQNVFSGIAAKINARNVGEFGAVHIGIVLGDKKFFVRSMSEWKARNISGTYIRPIVSKFSYLSGLCLQKADLAVWKDEDKPCYFFNTRGKRLGSIALGYLSSNEEHAAGNNSTFKRREIWHQPDDGKIADAFIGCISHFGPRLVLNSEKIQAANSIYRFTFTAHVSGRKKKLLAIALLTTFSQLSAELQGRPLGSGGLKLEPKDISRILVPMDIERSEAEIFAAFEEIDGLVRCGKHHEARLFADSFIFGSIITMAHQNVLCEGLDRIRTHRHREKSTRDNEAGTCR